MDRFTLEHHSGKYTGCDVKVDETVTRKASRI